MKGEIAARDHWPRKVVKPCSLNKATGVITSQEQTRVSKDYKSNQLAEMNAFKPDTMSDVEGKQSDKSMAPYTPSRKQDSDQELVKF